MLFSSSLLQEEEKADILSEWHSWILQLCHVPWDKIRKERDIYDVLQKHGLTVPKPELWLPDRHITAGKNSAWSCCVQLWIWSQDWMILNFQVNLYFFITRRRHMVTFVIGRIVENACCQCSFDIAILAHHLKWYHWVSFYTCLGPLFWTNGIKNSDRYISVVLRPKALPYIRKLQNFTL